MQIVVTHLTRMQPGFICVTGLDVKAYQHTRPELPSGRLTTEQLLRNGGPFGIGAIVDLGNVYDVGAPPEIEDRVFAPEHVRKVGLASPASFWRALQRCAKRDLHAIFGEALKPHGCTLAVDVGTGAASLGCLVPEQRPLLHVTGDRALWLRLEAAGQALSLPVTDVRLFEDDFRTPRAGVVARITARIRRGVGTILCVGLTRPWQKPDDVAPRHWLQVNNLHLEDDPTWNGE